MLLPRKRSLWYARRPAIVSGGGASSGLTFVASSYLPGSGTFDHGTDTHGPFSVGASQAGNKLIILPAFISDAFGGASSVTCNGTNMTMVGALNNGSSQRQTQFYYLEVPGSTTSVTIVIHGGNSGSLSTSTVGLYFASGYSSATPNNHAEAGRTLLTAPATQNLSFTVPASGFAIYMAQDENNETMTLGGSPVILDADLGNASGRILYNHRTIAGAASVTLQGSSGGYFLSSVVAAWS